MLQKKNFNHPSTREKGQTSSSSDQGLILDVIDEPATNPNKPGNGIETQVLNILNTKETVRAVGLQKGIVEFVEDCIVETINIVDRVQEGDDEVVPCTLAGNNISALADCDDGNDNIIGDDNISEKSTNEEEVELNGEAATHEMFADEVENTNIKDKGKLIPESANAMSPVPTRDMKNRKVVETDSSTSLAILQGNLKKTGSVIKQKPSK
ncbi:hypothetical protein FRX31_025166 [Thalictrum thalictroides]|uniref:Uncharacterized protein n=1 Tax=Thalictrum thalictroides TaxID=46969 RepID=A0A7J6VKF5_THATH|nr:hypothetical protein FRX31_025166 [Thalictrum thalictroides]